MVDLASPEARERIARAMCRREHMPFMDGRALQVAVDAFWDDWGDYADAALAEVAAMLKEGGDAH